MSNSKIDYTYIHNSACALISYLENVLKVEMADQQVEEVHRTLRDIAYHEHDESACNCSDPYHCKTCNP